MANYSFWEFSHSISSCLYSVFCTTRTSFTNPAGLGDFSVSTFYSAGNSVLPPGVNHLFNTSGVDNSANTVDRFWMVSKTASNVPSAPVANLTFRFVGTGITNRTRYRYECN
jgi:hypothetical protein